MSEGNTNLNFKMSEGNKNLQGPLEITGVTMIEKNGTTVSTVEADEEPDLITKNKGKIGFFRMWGFFVVSWKNGRYETSNARMLLSYLLTYFCAFACCGLAFGIKEIFKRGNKDYKDKIDDLIETSFAMFFLGIAPSCWIFLLKDFQTHFPLILILTKKLENTEMYKKLDISKNPKISYNEGFKDDDHSDELDEVFTEIQEDMQNQNHWLILEKLPLVGMIISVSTCVILIIVSWFVDARDIIKTASEDAVNSTAIQQNRKESLDSLNHLKHDLPSFTMTLLYPTICYISIWFCIFFIEWQRRVYSSIRQQIRSIIKKSKVDEDATVCPKLNEESKKELDQLCNMINQLQRVFILLNKKIFQKMLVHDFVLFLFLGTYTSVKILGSEANFGYVFPLSLVMGHIYLVCKWSNDLMGEFDEIIEVLNEMHEDDVEDLRRELHECPPQVCAFGGFGVNFSMMTALIGFMLTIISISSMFWPEIQADEPENPQCYEYADTIQGWNQILCVKQFCYDYTNNSTGVIQQFCINNEINSTLFTNGTLSVRNYAP